MTCPSPLTRALYVDEALDAPSRAAFELHLETCADCAAAIDRLRAENAALSRALHAIADPAPRPLFTGIALVRNIAIAAALLYAPAWALSRQPVFRFVVPDIIRQAQVPIALSLLLLTVAVAAFRYTKRRVGAAALTLAIGVPLGAAVYQTGEVTVLDSNVNDDVFVFARHAEIRGTVHGRIISLSQELEISGRVDGAVYAGAQTIRLSPTGSIGGKFFAGGESAQIAGRIGGAFNFYGDHLDISESARIAGPVTAHVEDPDRVTAPVGFPVSIDSGESEQSIAAPALAYLVALLLALAVGRFFPMAFDRSAMALTHWWKSFGTGIAVAVVMPAAALILACTGFGLPVSAVLLAVLTAAAYLAKLVVGALTGRLLLPERGRFVQLAFGLLLILAAVAAPFSIGGAISCAVTLSGLGAIAMTLRRFHRL
jgi:cytoskeletal protein CcmA (bactofilin family)